MNSFEHQSIELLADALAVLEGGFSQLPAHSTEFDAHATRNVLRAAAERMRGNYPYQHPLYVGQMLKPPHPVARMAYALAMWINPNNHALDGGRASSEMEKQSVAKIAKMFGWTDHLGHLCGGGTMANFEALWVARELNPGQAIAASEQSHYTHSRLCAVLDVPFRNIPVDPIGRMDLRALEQALGAGDIGTVVVTLGTTAAGTIDPLPEILELRGRYEFRIHVDAAYGGYFVLAGNLGLDETRAFARISEADSIVVDPHKHGLQPYGCGCILFRDPSVGRFYQHDSPYTYFTSAQLHLGEISLECSRAGASAVALWSTLELLPLEKGGEFARSLEACRRAALTLHAALEADNRFVPLVHPQLDIVVWAVQAQTSTEASRLAEQLFEKAAALDLHLAVASFPKNMCSRADIVRRWDSDHIRALRACVMKPEHEQWMPQLIDRLNAAAEDVLGERAG